MTISFIGIVLRIGKLLISNRSYLHRFAPTCIGIVFLIYLNRGAALAESHTLFHADDTQTQVQVNLNGVIDLLSARSTTFSIGSQQFTLVGNATHPHSMRSTTPVASFVGEVFKATRRVGSFVLSLAGLTRMEAMSGTFETDTGTWRLESKRDGRAQFTRIDEEQTAQCASTSAEVTQIYPSGRGTTRVALDTYGQLSSSSSVIRILVVYTSDAILGAGSEPALLTQIATAVTNMNVALTNSLIPMSVELGGTYLITELESGLARPDLDLIRNTGDGYADEIHSLRNSLSADIVVVVTGHTDGASGLADGASASSPLDPRRAFALVRQSDLTGLTFAHEVGHVMGLDHDRLHAAHTVSDILYPYAFGYSFTGNDSVAYGTVMSLVGARIPYFSNPSVQYAGQSTGVAENQPEPCNEAPALSLSAPTVSQYRPEMAATPATTPSTQYLSVASLSAAVVTNGTLTRADITAQNAQGTPVPNAAIAVRKGSGNNFYTFSKISPLQTAQDGITHLANTNPSSTNYIFLFRSNPSVHTNIVTLPGFSGQAQLSAQVTELDGFDTVLQVYGTDQVGQPLSYGGVKLLRNVFGSWMETQDLNLDQNGYGTIAWNSPAGDLKFTLGAAESNVLNYSGPPPGSLSLEFIPSLLSFRIRAAYADNTPVNHGHVALEVAVPGTLSGYSSVGSGYTSSTGAVDMPINDDGVFRAESMGSNSITSAQATVNSDQLSINTSGDSSSAVIATLTYGGITVLRDLFLKLWRCLDDACGSSDFTGYFSFNSQNGEYRRNYLPPGKYRVTGTILGRELVALLTIPSGSSPVPATPTISNESNPIRAISLFLRQNPKRVTGTISRASGTSDESTTVTLYRGKRVHDRISWSAVASTHSNDTGTFSFNKRYLKSGTFVRVKAGTVTSRRLQIP